LRLFRELRLISLIRVTRFSGEPIFIVGCGRSGTTILQAVLGAHPQIFSIPKETKIYLRTKRKKLKLLNSVKILTKVFVLLIKQDIPKGKKTWCEKTPRHVHYIKEILEDFNNRVKIINIVRDCRDVVLSSHPIYGENYISSKRWVKDVNAAKNFENNESVLTIRYEDFVQNFEYEIKKILAFIDVNDISLSDFNKKTNIVEHIAWWGKVEAINNTSVGKWMSAKKELIDEIMSDNEVVSLLKHYKYI